MTSIMNAIKSYTTAEELTTCHFCERTDQKDCIVFKIGGAGNVEMCCPDCVRGKATGESSESESEDEDDEEEYEPTFTTAQVRRFPTVLLNGMREQDVDGKWWIAVSDCWFPWCESEDEDDEDDEEEKAFQKELKERPCSDCGKDCHGDYSLGGIDKDGKMRKACMPCKKKDWEAAALKYKK
jgi:hypothetical protein